MTDKDTFVQCGRSAAHEPHLWRNEAGPHHCKGQGVYPTLAPSEPRKQYDVDNSETSNAEQFAEFYHGLIGRALLAHGWTEFDFPKWQEVSQSYREAHIGAAEDLLSSHYIVKVKP